MSRSLRAKPLSVVILLSAAASAVAAPTTIALTGQTEPGGTNGTFSAFNNAEINSSGTLLFTATLTGGTSTSGLYTGIAGGVQAAALQGTPIPGGAGSYNVISTPSINSSGTIVFNSSLINGTSTSAILTGSVGSIKAVALQGAAAVGTGAGTYSAFSTSYLPTINDSGTVAFSAPIGEPAGVAATYGLYTGTPGSVQSVAFLGDAAPAIAPATMSPGTFSTVFGGTVLNKLGQVTFISLVGGNQGVFAGSTGSLNGLTLQGAASPSGGTYLTPTLTLLSNNALGNISFVNGTTAGTGIFYAQSPSSAVQNLALVGMPNPALNGTGTLSSFIGPTVNAAGNVTFSAAITGGGTATYGLFQGTPGALKTLVLTGTPDPDGSGATLSTIAAPVPNGVGQVAFTGSLSGTGVTVGTNDTALFLYSPSGLTEVLRRGDMINVAQSPLVDTRTVNTFTLLVGGGGQDGKGVDLNDSGMLIYRLGFTDGSSGVFESVFPVPEPASLTLMGAGIGLILRRRRRRLS